MTRAIMKYDSHENVIGSVKFRRTSFKMWHWFCSLRGDQKEFQALDLEPTCTSTLNTVNRQMLLRLRAFGSPVNSWSTAAWRNDYIHFQCNVLSSRRIVLVRIHRPKSKIHGSPETIRLVQGRGIQWPASSIRNQTVWTPGLNLDTSTIQGLC